MVKTRSSTVFASSSSSSRKRKPPSSSSPLAPRKVRRRRTVSMPERKKKLRRQRALQKQIAIGNAPQPIMTEERRKPKLDLTSVSENPRLSSNASHNPKPNPKAACKKFTRKHSKSEKFDDPSANLSYKSSRRQAPATVDESAGERNPKPSQRKRKSNSKRCNRNNDVLLQSCKKVETSEPAEAYTGKHNRDQVVEVNHDHGWTSEQDAALQNAYFQIRPSSNFWFEVSKKVLGKTAKDCFDRFYSGHPTPTTTQPRSRKLAAESPVRTISFPSPMPLLNSKVRFGRGKQGLLKAHQTVRHILRQQRVADGTYETDVFSAVEQLSSGNSLLQDCTNRAISPLLALKGKDTSSESLVATPANWFHDAKSENELWWSVSSKQKPRSGHDQNQYTTRSGIQSQLLSPEVLKAECNPGRLDRFLDILHLRRVEKRKTSSKGISQGSCAVRNSMSFTQCVAAAREAIITDAKEVFETVLQQQSTVEEETSFLSDEESSLISDNEIL